VSVDQSKLDVIKDKEKKDVKNAGEREIKRINLATETLDKVEMFTHDSIMQLTAAENDEPKNYLRMS